MGLIFGGDICNDEKTKPLKFECKNVINKIFNTFYKVCTTFCQFSVLFFCQFSLLCFGQFSLLSVNFPLIYTYYILDIFSIYKHGWGLYLEANLCLRNWGLISMEIIFRGLYSGEIIFGILRNV